MKLSYTNQASDSAIRLSRAGAVAVSIGILALLSGCSPAEPSAGERGEVINAEASTAAPPDVPGVVIRRADFQIIFRLDGVSSSSDAVGLMSTPQLTFVASLPPDATIARGQAVGEAVISPEILAALEAASLTSDIDAGRLLRLKDLEGPIMAPVGGILALDGPLPVVRSLGIDVVVPLTPLQYLRYQSLRFTGRAVIETVVGAREVACEGVWIQQQGVFGDAIFGDGSVDFDGVPAGSSELRCRLPGHIETAPGLRSRVVLESQRMEDAVVVPVIYVGYDDETDGYTLKVIENGVVSTIPVVVGVTDGVVRVITSPVPIGAELVLPEEE